MEEEKEKKAEDIIKEIREEEILEEKNKDEDKKLTDKENKQLKKILIISGIMFAFILIIFIVIDSIRHFEYKDVKFDVVKEGNIIFYRTFFPMYSSITGKHVADYNVYLRNNPRKLKDIPFEGKIFLSENAVIDSTEEFLCDGDGIIAMANFVKIFDVFGTEVIRDPNASCDSQGRYIFVKIQSGNVTSIEQFGPLCYYLNINNCEILEVTEKFMVESIVEFNKNQGTLSS